MEKAESVCRALTLNEVDGLMGDINYVREVLAILMHFEDPKAEDAPGTVEIINEAWTRADRIYDTIKGNGKEG
jgi:hypothetical protein